MKLGKPLEENSFYDDDFRPSGLNDGTIFVFGSNLLGVHGKGAALDARLKFGAIPGVARGLQGQSYAFPTCHRPGMGLSLAAIEEEVKTFGDFVFSNPQLSFFVTAVACGYAGHSKEDIAPMFKGFQRCWFPASWKQYLENRHG